MYAGWAYSAGALRESDTEMRARLEGYGQGCFGTVLVTLARMHDATVF